MAENDQHDPFEKITELSNEITSLRDRVHAGEQAQARLDSLKAQHSTLEMDYDRTSKALRDARKELGEMRNEVANAKTAQRQAELDLQAEKDASEAFRQERDRAMNDAEGLKRVSDAVAEQHDELERRAEELEEKLSKIRELASA